MNRIRLNRFDSAIAISNGACNIAGIARTLVEACDEARANPEAYGLDTDPAIQLIISQLAYLSGVWDGVSDFHRSSFGEAREACRQFAIAYKGKEE